MIVSACSFIRKNMVEYRDGISDYLCGVVFVVVSLWNVLLQEKSEPVTIPMLPSPTFDAHLNKVIELVDVSWTKWCIAGDPLVVILLDLF